MSGHLLENLSFDMGYTFQAWECSSGEYPQKMEDRLSDKAKHQVKGRLRYRILPRTLCLLDYAYQSDQIERGHKTDPVTDKTSTYINRMDAHQVLDLAVEHTLLQDWVYFKDFKIKIFSNNILDREYKEARGYPMTERSFGCTLSCSF